MYNLAISGQNNVGIYTREKREVIMCINRATGSWWGKKACTHRGEEVSMRETDVASELGGKVGRASICEWPGKKLSQVG